MTCFGSLYFVIRYYMLGTVNVDGTYMVDSEHRHLPLFYDVVGTSMLVTLHREIFETCMMDHPPGK